MPLVSSMTVALVSSLTKSFGPVVTTGSVPLSLQYAASLASGTAAGQADIVYHATRTLGPSANEDIDLNNAGTTYVDPFGTPLAMLRVKGVFVAAAVANANNVLVGAAAANPWVGLLTATSTVTLRPGGFFAAVAGVADATAYGVVAGTGDLLRIANSGAGTSVTYDIFILGASA